MNETSLKKTLLNLNLGDVRYFDSIGSTNDEALAWATSGAKNFSLVIADEQTNGRGRLDRKWHTPKSSALAMSVILRPDTKSKPHLSRIVGMAALAIFDSLVRLGVAPQIKWPNDVLVNQKKIAGILVESVWSGNDIDALVIGIGMNVYQTSVPVKNKLRFPATSVEEEATQQPVPEREEIVKSILTALTFWYENLPSESFIKAWEEKLAFRAETVDIHQTGSATSIVGVLDGLESDGSLRLRDGYGKFVIVHFGDVSLRPLP
jgi:BirA family transcriptional regulator, biotin operon repressor / biotin---[acetyl-CoA-carboxylase] ligase